MDVLTKGCVCGCKKPATGPRGLNRSCYNRLNAEVASGKLTWWEAEQQGRCWPVANKKIWAKWNFTNSPPRVPDRQIKERKC